MKNRQHTVLVTVYTDFGLDVVASVPIVGNLQRKTFETHAIVFANGAFELLT